MEQELPDPLVADDGIPTLQPVRHIVDSKEKNGDETQNREDSASHIVSQFKGGSGHTEGSDLQTDVAEQVKEVVDPCCFGVYIFDVCETEESRQDTAEHAVADHGVLGDDVDEQGALQIVAHHDAAQNEDGPQHHAPEPLEPADRTVGIAEQDGVFSERIIITPDLAPAVG